ncbi:2'-5'-oligoadenylate synthase 2 [Sciurus carolinensis]|uniref:2'-5' oligoadenylate synthase n=1 Tax=Sciurus carolinensis TaxID=30640 RepID=A0AA41MGR3_SCICA|nr:2'-5'-oligoadenylate synthase 2 [Sciurus carolinensis]
MGNWESQVSSVPAGQLGSFVQGHLRPPEDCLWRVAQTLAAVRAALLEGDTFPVVRGVATGGSYGRGTVLKGHSDGTLVLFLDHLARFQDQKTIQKELLTIIEGQLKARLCARGLTEGCEILAVGGGLAIEVLAGPQTVSFEVLLAFDALGFGENPSPWVYRDLKRSMDETAACPGEFAVCFTELQERFFGEYPRKLKDLMLLMKCWYQQCQKRWGAPSSRPPYALELLAAYAWEQGCGAPDFDLAQGLRAVLRLIQQQHQLCVYWTVNYDFEDETVRSVLLHQLGSQSPGHRPTGASCPSRSGDPQEPKLGGQLPGGGSADRFSSPGIRRPVILDPVDPTNDVSGHIPWPRLKEEAELWLSSPKLGGEAPGHSWNVLPAPLFMTPGHLLDKFIKDFLQPSKDVLDQLGSAVDDICTFLQNDCFRHTATKVQRVVQGGSAAKGTALKNGSDADLVVFPSTIRSYASQRKERCRIIREIRKQLEAWQQEKKFEVTFKISKWKAPRVLSFSLKSKNVSESMDFNVLPAFDALGQLPSGSRPRPEVYAELMDLYSSSDLPGGEFSACFTELQRDFIHCRPAKLKGLIRLVKHWYAQCERKTTLKGSLPPKYALELLTVHAWEQGSGAETFGTAQGFRTVLELVTKYQQLCIFWTVNYDFEDEAMRAFLLTQIQKPRCPPVSADRSLRRSRSDLILSPGP